MNRFHSLAFGAILIFALSTPAQQTPAAPGTADKSGQSQPGMQDDVPSADGQLKVLTIKLDLTEDQQARIKPILQGVYDATVKISKDQYMQGPHPEMHGNLSGVTSSPQPLQK